MPSTAGATISIPPARAVYGVFQREVPSLDEEHNLQCSREVYQMESGFPRSCIFLTVSSLASKEAITEVYTQAFSEVYTKFKDHYQSVHPI
jgi:hypothetical protein